MKASRPTMTSGPEPVGGCREPGPVPFESVARPGLRVAERGRGRGIRQRHHRGDRALEPRADVAEVGRGDPSECRDTGAARGSRSACSTAAGIASSTRTRSDCRRASNGGGGSSRSNHGPSTCEVRNTASRSQLRSTTSSQCTRAIAAPSSRWSTCVATGSAPRPSASIVPPALGEPGERERELVDGGTVEPRQPPGRPLDAWDVVGGAERGGVAPLPELRAESCEVGCERRHAPTLAPPSDAGRVDPLRCRGRPR